MTLGAEHGNVSAIRMSDQCQMLVVGIGPQFFQLAKHMLTDGKPYASPLFIRLS